MRHNNKYTLKIEDGHGALQFKLGDILIDDMETLENKVNDEQSRNKLHKAFQLVHDWKAMITEAVQEGSDEEFDEII